MRKRWEFIAIGEWNVEFIAIGEWNGQTSGYAFGLRIPLPAGNKFPSFPQTYELLLYYYDVKKFRITITSIPKIF